MPNTSIASTQGAGTQPNPNIISDEIISENIGSVDIFGPSLKENKNVCVEISINHQFNNTDIAGNNILGNIDTSTFSDSITESSEAHILVDSLLETEVDLSQQKTPILSPLILSTTKENQSSETYPSPTDFQSTLHQLGEGTHIIPRKLSLATVQELEIFEIPSPPTSPETTLSIALPASSLSFTTAISNLPRPISLLPSMSESSGSADIYSQSYDPHRNFDCSDTNILKRQDDLTNSEADSRCFGCDTEKIKQCWVHAMRLAKVSESDLYFVTQLFRAFYKFIIFEIFVEISVPIDDRISVQDFQKYL